MMGETIEKIYGRHPIHEVLLAKRRRVFRIYVAKGTAQQGLLQQILQMARDTATPVEFVERDALDEVYDHHQGVIAEVSAYPYVAFVDILKRISKDDRPGLVLLLDVLQNPQNFGTLLRSAEAVGVQGVVIPPRRAANVTAAVVRSSAGASEHLWIARENLVRAIQLLKREGLWIVGLQLSPEANLLGQVDLSGPLGLVVGGEDRGLRRLVRESCDFLLKLPMGGQISSLNAAVAGSITLYAIWQARGFIGSDVDGREGDVHSVGE
jgi:23S rRNA (guanosine2251-2'-O)-methyltransferase